MRSLTFAFLLAASLWGVAGRNSENPYVNPAACASCHLEQQEGYLETGMARSVTESIPFLSRILGEGSATYYHVRSDRHYTVLRRDGEYFLRRHQVRNGEKVHQFEKRIDLVIGSGNHAATLVHRSEQGLLQELPLTWYSASGGYWAMSPGYDNPNHFGFRREIAPKCRFCHSAYPQTPGLSDIGPIDCQRCHGPGREHMESVSSGSDLEKVRNSIINPARLTPPRALDTCLQCHLETTSRPLPDSLFRDRDRIFSYQPGEPLGDFKVYFDHPDDHPLSRKFEVNSAGYRFLKSSCFRASEGRFQCIACHNPHRHTRGERMEDRTRIVCLECHSGGLAKVSGHNDESDCVSCHMPKRRAEDAVHVTVTDHAILRRPAAQDPSRSQDELDNARRSVYRGEVKPFYPPDFPSTVEDRLYVALAQVVDESNLAAGLPELEEWVRQEKPADGDIYTKLGKARLRSGDRTGAVEALEKAVELKPDDPAPCQILGELLLQDGKTARALKRLEKCSAAQPFDAALQTTLAISYGQSGQIEKAVKRLQSVLNQEPDRVATRINLGTALEYQGALTQAAAEYRTAIAIQPDLGLAHFYLANVLAADGDKEAAARHYREAGELDPTLRERVDRAMQELQE